MVDGENDIDELLRKFETNLTDFFAGDNWTRDICMTRGCVFMRIPTLVRYPKNTALSSAKPTPPG